MTKSINEAPVSGRQVSFYVKHDTKGLIIHVASLLATIIKEYPTDIQPEDLPDLADDLIQDYKHWKLADFAVFARLAARGKLKRVIDYVSFGVVKNNLSKRLIEEMAKVYDYEREETVERELKKKQKIEPPTHEEMVEFQSKIDKMKEKAAIGKLKPPLDFNESLKKHGIKSMADLKKEDEDFKNWRKQNGY